MLSMTIFETGEIMAQVTELKEHASPLEETAVKDIYVAAYLAALGYKLQMARSDGYQSEFYFKNVDGGDIIKYYNGEAHTQLSPRKLFDSFQNMRRVSRQVRLVPNEKGASQQRPPEDDDL